MSNMAETINKILDGGNVGEIIREYITNIEAHTILLEMPSSINLSISDNASGTEGSKIISVLSTLEWRIQVRGGREEGHKDDPHFHVLGIPRKEFPYRNNYIYNVRVRLESADYPKTPEVTLRLCPFLLSKIIRALESPSKTLIGNNNWQAFCQYWNMSDGMRAIDLESTAYPGYTKLITLDDIEFLTAIENNLGGLKT